MGWDPGITVYETTETVLGSTKDVAKDSAQIATISARLRSVAELIESFSTDGMTVDLAEVLAVLGANTDAAIITDADGSISGKLRGLVTLLLSRLKIDPIAGQSGVSAGAGNVDATTQRIVLAADGPTVSVLGNTSDAAVYTDTTGSISGKLRGLVKIFADVWDSLNHLLKVQEQSPAYAQHTATAPVDLLNGTPYELTAAFADVAGEIYCAGYNQLGLWPNLIIGTSTSVQLRILYKHTSAGADEYRQVYLGTPGSNITTVALNDVAIETNANQKFYLNIPLNGNVAYIQIQAKDAANGDGQIASLHYTLAYA